MRNKHAPVWKINIQQCRLADNNAERSFKVVLLVMVAADTLYDGIIVMAMALTAGNRAVQRIVQIAFPSVNATYAIIFGIAKPGVFARPVFDSFNSHYLLSSSIMKFSHLNHLQ